MSKGGIACRRIMKEIADKVKEKDLFNKSNNKSCDKKTKNKK